MKLKISVILLAVFLLTGCANEAPKSETPRTDNVNSTSSASQPETFVLSFTANSIDGQEFSSEQFGESKITMINVWATYCNPCLAEMPDLGELPEEYDKTEFQIVGIISDVAEGASQSDIDNAKDLIAQTKANYPHLLLNQELFDELIGGVSSVPTTFFVNAEGEMLGYVVGANDKDTWEEIIDDLLAKEGVMDD